jgi:hypothetical protein
MPERKQILDEVCGWARKYRIFLRKNESDWAQILEEQAAWARIYREHSFWPWYFRILLDTKFRANFSKIIEMAFNQGVKLDGTPVQLAAFEIRNRDMMMCAAALARGATIEAEALHDPYAFDATCRVVATLLISGSPLRNGLEEFAAAVITGSRRRPGRPGLSSEKLFFRDLFICNLLRRLEARGLNITRNDASKHRNTACDLLSEALLKNGLKPTSYNGVKDVWERRPKQP